jgi:hypothetical protein
MDARYLPILCPPSVKFLSHSTMQNEQFPLSSRFCEFALNLRD